MQDIIFAYNQCIYTEESDRQVNWTVILVDHMLFSHTSVLQMFIENISLVSVVYMHILH